MISLLFKRIGAALLAGSIPSVGPAIAQDLSGCNEPEGFKRFVGSRLVLCDDRNFDRAEIATGKLIDSADFTKKVFTSKIDVAGKAARRLYAVPKGSSTEDVFNNYRISLEQQGFSSLYSARGYESIGSGFDSRHAESFKDLTALQSFHADSQFFGSFLKDEGSLKTYVMVFAVDGEPGSYPAGSREVIVAPGDVLLRLDVIWSGSLQNQMVIVKAREMQQALASTGHINLYGILFDFNKFDVRPDSRPALDEISAFLKSNPDRKLKIVGHTDNVGGAEFNLQLSRARAAAVVNELTAKYGIDAGRLKAEGAGLTRPIATNDTDEGRARNRRVELIALN